MNSTVQNNLKILVVEDDTSISNVCRMVLESQGHNVTLASDGQEGIDAYLNSLKAGKPFDIVKTDYRMPKKDGAQLIKEVFAINPDQKIILATAYGAEVAHLGIANEKVPVLSKPFSIDDLTKLIQKQMESRHQP